MKNLGLTLALLAAASPAMAAPAINAPADVAAIKALEQQNAVALDPAALARTYAPNVTVLDFMKGGIYRSRQAFQAAETPQLKRLKTITANIPEQNIVTDGSFACDMLTLNFNFTTQDGKSNTMSLRQMDALQKIAGKWQVVQEQLAVLKDPASNKPVMTDFKTDGDMVWPASIDDFQTVPVAQARREILDWANTSFRVIGIKAIVPYYGPGEDEYAAYAPTAPGNIRGLKGLYDYYAPSMNYFKSIEMHTPVLGIATDGTLGSEISVQLITLHLWDGKTKPLYWRQSDCLHRVGGKWYGLLTQSSFPLDAQTGQMYTGGLTFLAPANAKTAKPAS